MGALTTYTYDLAGNRTSEQPPAGSSTLYAWDAAGRMISAEVEAGMITLTYNADGQRTAKQGTDGSVVGFLYDGKRLLHETDEVGGDITNTYAAGTNDEFGDLIGEGDGQSHAYDAEANTNALMDSSGTVQAQYKYTAFGEVQAVSLEGGAWSGEAWGSLPMELSTHMLAGGRKQYYLDMETALYLLGSGNRAGGGRYYDAITVRFLSEDPSRQKSADPNLFPYVQNDPINQLDPSGHDKDPNQTNRQDQQKQQQMPSTSAWQILKDANHRILDADKRALWDAAHGHFDRIKADMQDALTPPPPVIPRPAQQQPQNPPASPTARPGGNVAPPPSGTEGQSNAPGQQQGKPRGSTPAGGKPPEGKSGGPPPQQRPTPTPGATRLGGAIMGAGLNIPPEVARDPQFQQAMNRADEWYAKFKTDRNAKNFNSADDYVAMHLSQGVSGPLSIWFMDNVSGTLSTHSAKGQQQIAANQASYAKWAASHTGVRGFIRDAAQVSRGYAEGMGAGELNVLDKFTYGKINAVHQARENAWNKAGLKGTWAETGSDVGAVVAREAFTTALGMGVGQVASGGAKGVSISSQIVNTLAKSKTVVQTARVANAGITAVGIVGGVEQTHAGIQELQQNPKSIRGYVDTGVGVVSTLLGAHGAASESKAAQNAAGEVRQGEKAVAAVEKDATSVKPGTESAPIAETPKASTETPTAAPTPGGGESGPAAAANKPPAAPEQTPAASDVQQAAASEPPPSEGTGT